MKRLCFCLSVLLCLLSAQFLAATDYYVATNGSDGNPGTQSQPWRTIAKANSTLQPGDQVFIRGGTYYESIEPSRNGSAGNYITYKNFGSEDVTITDVHIAVDLPERDYIWVEGLRIIDVGVFVEIVGGNRNIISNCHMDGADSNWGSVRILNGSSYNKILNNRISHGNGDTVYIASADPYPGSNSNLISGNDIDSMGSTHGAIMIRTIYTTDNPEGGPFAGNSDCMYNVVRGNYVHHADDDCIMGSEYSRRNVYEDNIVTMAGYEGDHDIGTGLKYVSSYNIIRRNIVYDNPSAGFGLRSQIRKNRYLPNIGNRAYHNVFYNNGDLKHGLNYASCGMYYFGYGNGPEAMPIEDNIVVNNIFMENAPYHQRIEPDLVVEDVMRDNTYENNIMHPSLPVDFLGISRSLDYMESNTFQQVQFANNLEQNPSFVNANNHNFNLNSNSAAIDAGRFLTKVRSNGSGNVIPVEDASYFMDGFGIVAGDLIQLEGEQTTARITDINYNNNQITVDRNLSWQAGQGVSLPYNGNSPDIGAKEWGGTSSLSAGANANTFSGQAPLTVQFTGSASGGNSPYTYSWTFGDGASSTQQNPSHTYSQSGNFTARLTVTDNSGSQDSASLNINVSEPTSQLTVSAGATPLSGNAPLNVSFTGSVSGGSPPYTYRWTFGDGDSSAQKDPSHTYSQPSYYTATFTVTDNADQQKSATVGIAVSSSGPGEARLHLSISTGQPAGSHGGTITPSVGTHVFSLGTQVQLEAKPNQGFRFARWIGDVGETQIGHKDITITLSQDKTLNAAFCSLCGDVNGDLRLSPLDSQAVFDIFLGKNNNPTFCQSENADVNGDGSKTRPYISPADAQAIFVKYLGKGELPCDCSYSIRTANSTTQSIQGEFGFSQVPTQDIHLGLDQLRRVSETEIHLPVMINNPQNIDAFGFDLVYPAEYLEFVGLAKTEMVKDFYQVEGNKKMDGMLRVGGYSSDPIMNPEGGELVLLIFKLIKKGVNVTSDLYINKTFDDVANAYYVKPESGHGAQKSRNYVRR